MDNHAPLPGSISQRETGEGCLDKEEGKQKGHVFLETWLLVKPLSDCACSSHFSCVFCLFLCFQLLLCTGGILLGWPVAFLRTWAVALFQADSSCFERSASGPQPSTVATVHGDTSHQVRGKDTFKCTPTWYYFQGSKHCRIWMRFPQVSLDIRILEKRSFLQGGLVILLMKVHFD